MKAKINSNGFLEVERKGGMREQFCPYAVDASGNRGICGDWCPKFDENTSYVTIIVGKPVMQICGGPSYEIVLDEREQGGDAKQS